MSDKLSKRRSASRKPSLAAVIYKFDKAKETSNATPDEIREVRAVQMEPTSPAAWERVINREIRNAT